MQITSMNVATAITKLVACDALPALLGNLTVGNLVARDFEPVSATVGDTVNVPVYPYPASEPVVLSTHAEAIFRIPDITKVLAVPDLLRLYMQPAVEALAEKIETDLLATHAWFTANSPMGAAGTPISEASIDSAAVALFNAKADPAKYLVVSGEAYSQLRQFGRFSEYSSATDAGLRALIHGSVGKIKDFFVFRSRFVSKTGNGPVTTQNLAFSKNALGLVVRRLPQPLPGTGAIAEYAELGNFGMRVVMTYQPNTLAQQFTIDLLYGVGVLRNDFAVVVRS